MLKLKGFDGIRTAKVLCCGPETGGAEFALCVPAGYTLAGPASTAVASQLKQAVSLGQDLTAYTTYDGYPAFAVAARHTDGYGVF